MSSMSPVRPAVLDLKAELEARDLSVGEAARASGLNFTTVSRMLHGSPGSTVSRRALREALARFPIVERSTSAPAHEPEPTPAEAAVVRQRDGAELLAEIRSTSRDPWEVKPS